MIRNTENVRMGRDITIQCWNRTIILHKKFHPNILYSFCKEMWRENPIEYIKYFFPVDIGINQKLEQRAFAINGWKFVGKTSNVINESK